MKLVILPLGVAIIGLGFGCVQVQGPGDRAEIGRVQAVANGLMAADSARDVQRVVALYAPDAIMLPPGESPVEGIAAVRQRYDAFFQTNAPGLYFVIEETVVVSDLAYVRGRTRGTIRSLSGVADQPVDDVFLMILRRFADDTWRITRLMWHAAAAEG